MTNFLSDVPNSNTDETFDKFKLCSFRVLDIRAFGNISNLSDSAFRFNFCLHSDYSYVSIYFIY